MPPTLRAARIRRQVLRVGEKRLEELLMELVEAVVGQLQKPEVRLFAEARHRQVVNRQADHALGTAAAELPRPLFAENLEDGRGQPFPPLDPVKAFGGVFFARFLLLDPFRASRGRQPAAVL